MFMSAAKVVENAVSKSLEKDTDIFRKKRWPEYYWIASSVILKRKILG